MKKIIIISDLHEPYSHGKKVQEVLSISRDIKPDIFILNGDAYDFASFTRFPKKYSHKSINPAEEVAEARSNLEILWNTLHKCLPKTQKYFLKGNHSDRLEKRIMEKMPELKGIFSFKHLFEFPNVRTIHDSRQELIIDNVCFMHGYRTQPGSHMRYNQMSTVVGHSHRGHCLFMPLKNETLFELNTGHLSDPLSEPLSYTPQKISNWTHGFGLIDELGPRFIPL